MRLLVCGGRDFADRDLFWWRMGQVDERYPVAVVITGCARGADAMARQWAGTCGRELLVFKADWDGPLGKRAGTERNYRMATQGKPDLVLAFPGGPGTLNMVGYARHLGITCWMAERK